MSGLATMFGQFWGVAFLLLFVVFVLMNVFVVKYYVGDVRSDLKDIKLTLKEVGDGVIDNRTEIKLLKQHLGK